MIPCGSRPPRLRFFCMYLLTTILLTTIIYVAISSHSQVVIKVEQMELDIKYLLKEVSYISREVFQPKTDKVANEDQKAVTQPPCISSSSKDVEALIGKQMDALRIEWSRTKQNIDIMIQEMQKEIASTQLPGQDARTDFALESLGGQIVDVKDTSFLRANFLLMLLGLAPVQNEPGNLIRESLSPGDCYAFKGTNSTVTIRLMTKVYIDSVTVQHIPENLAPDGNISSAPKDFSVYGLRTRFDPKPFYFGTFSYNAKLRKPAQVFIFMHVATEKHRYVQFRFFSNHGNANYTCIYRLSVHGRLEMNKSTSDPQT